MVRSDGEGAYAIDSEQGTAAPGNLILMDLGKTLERMLTMSKEEFREEYLRSKGTTNHGTTEDIIAREAYHYLKKGTFLIRSRLDCAYYDKGEDKKPKVFDLKTRATIGVRIDPSN